VLLSALPCIQFYFTFVVGHYHIFVGDLSPDVETHQLREAFAPFGQTTCVYAFVFLLGRIARMQSLDAAYCYR